MAMLYLLWPLRSIPGYGHVILNVATQVESWSWPCYAYCGHLGRVLVMAMLYLLWSLRSSPDHGRVVFRV
jgi:integral membrane sensor domain MASE1